MFGWVRTVAARIRGVVATRAVDEDFTQELDAHLAMLTDENISRGMAPEEARRVARLRLGGETQLRETHHEQWSLPRLETFLQDIRYAVRMLRRSPGFTAVAILSLALGIGANTAIFTLINDLMLKPLAVQEPQQLVLFGNGEDSGEMDGIQPGKLGIFTYDFYKRIENNHEALQGITAFGSFHITVSVRANGKLAGPSEQVESNLVSGTFFAVLGVKPLLGRPIEPSDTVASGQNAVAVISYRYWKQSLSGDPGIIGRTITVNSTPFTVIGVAPSEFYGIELDTDPGDMWFPVTMQEQVMLQPSLLDPQGLYWLHMMARTKSGVSVKQAQEWVNLQNRAFMEDREGAGLTEQRRKEIQGVDVDLLPGSAGFSRLRREYTDSLRILMGVVVLVLLIACGNLANFLLAKTASREREISVRLAIGATRMRIVRQMLTETLLLSLLGGAAGLLFAAWGTRALIAFVASGATYAPIDPNPDARVLAFSLGVSLLTGILFGLAPALRISRNNLSPGLKSGTRSVGENADRPGRISLQKMLVVAQTALSLLLVMGAGLFVNTFRNLEKEDFGFDRKDILIGRFDPNIAGYKAEQLDGLYRQLLDRLNSLPGIQSATLSGSAPMSHGRWSSPIFVQGRTPRRDEDLSSNINRVTQKYFETLEIPLLQGRTIVAQDVPGSSKVVVINQAFARHFFPQGGAIGQRVRFGAPGIDGDWTIAGIVGDTKDSGPRGKPGRMIYLPVVQLSGNNRYAFSVEVRTAGDPSMVAEEVRSAFKQIDENMPLLDLRTITEQVGTFIDREELISQISGFFSALALILAGIGLYGMMTYNVVRRTNEIGIRMALGAQTKGVLWMVLKESLELLGIGIAIGIPLALASGQLVRAQLFGVKATDPLTIGMAAFVVSVVTLLAGYIPARRAMRVDPMVALRYE
jgi:predicted permease